MEKISKDWTPEERLKVIFRLSSGLRLKLRDTGGNVPAGEVFDVSDRIALLSGMPAHFLETNREQLLEGYYRDAPADSI